jgi:hypothetical protein
MGLAPFAKSTRAEDMAWYRRMDDLAVEKGLRDGSVVERSDWKQQFLVAGVVERLRLITGPSVFRSAPLSCVPFSWIEPSAKEKDTCELSERLELPISGNLEGRLLWDKISYRLFAKFREQVLPTFMSLAESLESQKILLLGRLREEERGLASLSQRSTREEAWLLSYQRRLAELEAMEPKAAVTAMVADIDRIMPLIDEEEALAKRESHPEMALGNLGGMRASYQYSRNHLERLLGQASFAKPLP